VITVHTFLNLGAGIFSDFLADDALMAGPDLAIDATDPTDALHETYAVGNRVGGDARGRSWPSQVRSLSVGDVLVVEEAAFVVAPIGFTPVDAERVDRACREGVRRPELFDLDTETWRAEWPDRPATA
jgi:hypothetical protein